jgi:CheY-like chemotaxis protein
MTVLENKPARVLVVDDNRDTAITLGLLLGAAGYQVETTFDGESALKAAERFAPDACVLDIDMPGMDGYELARRLRAMGTDRQPVLATVTGYNHFQHLDRAVEAGFDLHFSKPVDPADMAEQLSDSLGR